MTAGNRRLEAPHRRAEAGPRVVEKAAVVAYRTASWALARVPARPAALAIGMAGQLSYLAWPQKRRWSNTNFGHVLGLPPDHPRVRRLALRAYREYGRYLIEVMRLTVMTRAEVSAMVRPADIAAIEEIREGVRGGLIFSLAHVGNTDVVAAAVADRGWPINVLADDSAFQELFEDFRRQREAWGAHVIPWRNLREIYTVLRRREMLGLLIDWGYRDDGIPVRLFDAWTTLPSGPATLAAKTGSRILPVGIRRVPGGFAVTLHPSIDVPSSTPAELQRATQRMADALAATIAAAPEQWYSFKPIWPATVEEQAALEARAEAMAAGREAPGVVDPELGGAAGASTGPTGAAGGASPSSDAVTTGRP